MTEIKNGILKPDPNAFSEVELTEEEKAMALMEKRREKAGKLAYQAYQKKLSTPPKTIKKTSEQIYNDFEKSGLIIDSSNESILSLFYILEFYGSGGGERLAFL